MEFYDDAVRDAAIDLSKQLCVFAAKRLGSEFIGFYLLGSLAHGGFNRRYSDIDVAIITQNGVDKEFLRALQLEAEVIDRTLAPRISLFWTDRKFSIGRFPPLDRLDYIENAIALKEDKKVIPPKPSPMEIKAYLRGAPLERWAKWGIFFSTQSELDKKNQKTLLKTFLYPARFSYSWITGQIGSNDTALKYLHDHPIEGLDITLMDRALACRHAAADPDILFDDRFSLPNQYKACAKLIEHTSIQ